MARQSQFVVALTDKRKFMYDTCDPSRDTFFEIPERPLIEREGSIKTIDESAPAPPQQAYLSVGKLMHWRPSYVAGTWKYVSGVISSGGYRWTFGAKDILCKETDLVEGTTVSFRSLMPEDFRGLGFADQIKPYEETSQPQPQPKPETNSESRPQLPELSQPAPMTGVIQ
jgi:hypothetical protein